MFFIEFIVFVFLGVFVFCSKSRIAKTPYGNPCAIVPTIAGGALHKVAFFKSGAKLKKIIAELANFTPPPDFMPC
ncbi:MAG: hypothetical protein R2830_15465 [Saprospiraceae bacterium]